MKDLTKSSNSAPSGSYDPTEGPAAMLLEFD